jgi:hypothetical protein
MDTIRSTQASTCVSTQGIENSISGTLSYLDRTARRAARRARFGVSSSPAPPQLAARLGAKIGLGIRQPCHSAVCVERWNLPKFWKRRALVHVKKPLAAVL